MSTLNITEIELKKLKDLKDQGKISEAWNFLGSKGDAYAYLAGAIVADNTGIDTLADSGDNTIKEGGQTVSDPFSRVAGMGGDIYYSADKTYQLRKTDEGQWRLSASRRSDVLFGGAGQYDGNTDVGSLANMVDFFGNTQKYPGIGKNATNSIAPNIVQKSASGQFDCKFMWQRTPHSHHLQRHAQTHPTPNVHSMSLAGRNRRARPMGSAWRGL